MICAARRVPARGQVRQRQTLSPLGRPAVPLAPPQNNRMFLIMLYLARHRTPLTCVLVEVTFSSGAACCLSRRWSLCGVCVVAGCYQYAISPQSERGCDVAREWLDYIQQALQKTGRAGEAAAGYLAGYLALKSAFIRKVVQLQLNPGCRPALVSAAANTARSVGGAFAICGRRHDLGQAPRPPVAPPPATNARLVRGSSSVPCPGRRAAAGCSRRAPRRGRARRRPVRAPSVAGGAHRRSGAAGGRRPARRVPTPIFFRRPLARRCGRARARVRRGRARRRQPPRAGRRARSRPVAGAAPAGPGAVRAARPGLQVGGAALNNTARLVGSTIQFAADFQQAGGRLGV